MLKNWKKFTRNEVPEGRASYNSTDALILPGIASGSGGTQALVKDRLHYIPIKPITPIVIDQITIEVTSAAAGSEKCRIAIYRADINWQPLAQIVATAEIAIDANAVVDTAIADTTLREARYLIGINVEGNVTLRTANIAVYPTMGYLTTLGATPRVGIVYVSAAYGALPDPGTAWGTVITASYNAMFAWFNVKTP